MNIELFKKVRDRIKEIPESYNQSAWQTPSSRSPCGTAACLAGEAIICAAPTVEEGVAELRMLDLDSPDDWAVPRRAAELLGLTGDFSSWAEHHDDDEGGETVIFDAEGVYWPEPFSTQFMEADDRYGRTAAAVAYLDWIIENGRVL